MNKRRRRIGKARRHKARVRRELRAWTCSRWTAPPKGGRLRLPVLGIVELIDRWTRDAAQAFATLAEPLRSFADLAGAGLGLARAHEELARQLRASDTAKVRAVTG